MLVDPYYNFDSTEEGLSTTRSLEFELHACFLFTLTWICFSLACTCSLELFFKLPRSLEIASLELARLKFSTSWGCRLPPKMHPNVWCLQWFELNYSTLLIATQNNNDSLVSGSAENAPENYTVIQLDFDFTLTKKIIAILQWMLILKLNWSSNWWYFDSKSRPIILPLQVWFVHCFNILCCCLITCVLIAYTGLYVLHWH